MRYVWIIAPFLTIIFMLLSIAAGMMIIANRTSLLLHAAIAQATPLAIDWQRWQSSGDITFSPEGMQAATDVASQSFWEGIRDMHLDKIVYGFTILYGTAPYELHSWDRVWGTANRDVISPPYIAACAIYDIGALGIPSIRGGRECAVVALREGLLEPLP